jgi:N utilization substance protein B
MAAKSSQPQEDVRRQLTLWVLMTAESAAIEPAHAFRYFEEAFIAPHIAPTANEKTPFFAVERFEDYLPTPEAWAGIRDRVQLAVLFVGDNKAQIDASITKASPRWRLERMPIVDRTLLRMGVAEFMSPSPRPRATLNGLIEMAKKFGNDTTPGFINGILDQIRRNLDIPFA